MAFFVHSTDDGRVPGLEYLPCGAITPKVGMALMWSEGNLIAASGTNRPAYISMCERDTACEKGDVIPVMRAASDVIYETAASVAMTSVKPGNKVTLSADGMSVTATTGGAAEIVSMDGTDVGSAVRVRFA